VSPATLDQHREAARTAMRRLGEFTVDGLMAACPLPHERPWYAGQIRRTMEVGLIKQAGRGAYQWRA
jgi:hypothetical protein